MNLCNKYDSFMKSDFILPALDHIDDKKDGFLVNLAYTKLYFTTIELTWVVVVGAVIRQNVTNSIVNFQTLYFHFL